MPIASTEEIIQAIKRGQMVILADDESRENEGDLILAADFVTPEAINFMVTHARGLVCLTLTQEKCHQLGLSLMTRDNASKFHTAFTISIEAAHGVTTGISAYDRAKTVQVAIAKDAKPSDLVQPGHIFPIMAKPGGVLMRAGHTEAGCDLAHLAGLTPASVICEILKEDGTMARMPDLLEFAKKHQLLVGTIADLIRYRSEHESIIERQGTRTIQTPYGAFNAIAYRDRPSLSAHLALYQGDVANGQETFVRVHQPLSVIDLLETETSHHSWTIAKTLQKIAQEKRGVLVLLNCEETSEAVFEAFLDKTPKSLSLTSQNLRTYGIGAKILQDLGIQKMKLLAHPINLPSMAGFGLEVTGFISPHHEGVFS